MEHRGWDEDQMDAEWQRRIRVLDHLKDQGIRDFQQVNQIVHEYYRHPERVMERIGAKAEDAWD